jgi:hypothetical protein
MTETIFALPFLKPADKPECMAYPELFFSPDPEEGLTTHQVHAVAVQAVEICERCPFRVDCAEYALNRPYLRGTWGGLTDSGRTRLRQRMQKQGFVPSERVPWWAGGNGDWVEFMRRQEALASERRMRERDISEITSEYGRLGNMAKREAEQ